MALWFSSSLDDPIAWRSALLREMPDLEVVDGDLPPDPDAIEYALVYDPTPGRLAGFANLRAVFSLAAGVDKLLADPELPDVPLCRMVDAGLTSTIADYAHHAVLHVHRGFDGFARDQEARRWTYVAPRTANEVAVAVLGLGVLGTAVATRLAGHGYRVSAWSRRPRHLENVRTLQGAEALAATLAGAEVVVALLPQTAATTNLFDARFFAAMEPGAHFVNLGRGAQVVEPSLLAALDDGRIGGATLDVFREEPLAPDHPFWGHPRIRITPHIAGSPAPASGAAVVARNIDRLRSGLPLLNLVDRTEAC